MAGLRGYSRLKLLILDVLRGEPLHGYAIIKRLEGLVGSRPSPGTIYPLLHEMLREGLVEVRVSGSSGRIVKTYYITEKGRRYLESRMDDLQGLLLLIKGFRIASDYGFGETLKALMELIRLLPRLPEDGRERIRSFLEHVRREALELVEEVSRHAGRR